MRAELTSLLLAIHATHGFRVCRISISTRVCFREGWLLLILCSTLLHRAAVKAKQPRQFKPYSAQFFFLVPVIKGLLHLKKSKRKKKIPVYLWIWQLFLTFRFVFFSASQCSMLSTCFNNLLDWIRPDSAFPIPKEFIGSLCRKRDCYFSSGIKTLFQNLDWYEIKSTLKNLVSNVIVNTCSATEN